MRLTPTIQSVCALFRKLERENYRVLHARNALHRDDNFMNFCITAHSMQDHLLEYLGAVVVGGEKAFKKRWRLEPTVQATADIANESKHFILRDRRSKKPRDVQTKGVRRGKSEYVDIYEANDGSCYTNLVSIPDYFVRLSDGSRHDLHSFMKAVLNFGDKSLLQGLKSRRQTFESLSGYANTDKPSGAL